LRVEEARDAEMLRMADVAPPAVDIGTLIARAARTRPSWRRRQIAAGAGSKLLAGAAAAMPGSPVRAYVARLFRQAPPVLAPAPVAPDRAPTAPAREGIAFIPGATVDVAWRAPERTGTIRITIVRASSVRLTHQGGTATYTLTANGVVIENRGSTASFNLALPEAVVRARVTVGGRTVFTKSGADVQTQGVRDSTGTFLVPLSTQPFPHQRLP